MNEQPLPCTAAQQPGTAAGTHRTCGPRCALALLLLALLWYAACRPRDLHEQTLSWLAANQPDVDKIVRMSKEDFVRHGVSYVNMYYVHPEGKRLPAARIKQYRDLFTRLDLTGGINTYQPANKRLFTQINLRDNRAWLSMEHLYWEEGVINTPPGETPPVTAASFEEAAKNSHRPEGTLYKYLKPGWYEYYHYYP